MSERLSRIVSRALRHAPDEYGLVLDSKGWALLPSLLEGIMRKHDEFGAINVADIESITREGERFELEPQRIRARYGHSHIEIDHGPPQLPPAELFHATGTRAFADIASKGLTAQDRKFVHLTSSWEYGYRIYEQRQAEIGGAVILVIAAKEAWTRTGVPFFRASDSIWLAGDIDRRFISLAVLSPGTKSGFGELRPLVRAQTTEATDTQQDIARLSSLFPED